MVRGIAVLAAFVLTALAPTPDAIAAADRVALVIGNGAYTHASKLPNPANDAADIALALRRIGFDVVEGRDLDKRGMEAKIVEFGGKLDRAGVALFFYAGHGMQVAGRNYLVPIDARLERAGNLNFETVDVAFVLAQMEAEKRVNLVFLDACRDNPLSRTFARSLGASRSGAVGRGLASLQSAVGTMIAYATQPDNVALDGDGRNSPFTTALIKHIATPGLEIRSMMTRVRADVLNATRERQLPWDHSSLIGEVVLVPGTTPPPAPPSQSTGTATAPDTPAPGGGLIASFLDRFAPGAPKPQIPPTPPPQSPGPVAALAPMPVAPQAEAPPVLDALGLPAVKPLVRVAFDVSDIGPHQQRDATPATACDRNLASPTDWEKAPGIPGSEVSVKPTEAEASCREALRQFPQSRRLRALLSRAIRKQPGRREETRRLLIESARLGNLDAAFVVAGDIAYGSNGAQRDFRRALRLLEDIGNRGYVAAYATIGGFYDSAERPDRAQALRWRQKAAALGHGPTLALVGNAYQNGHGVAKNFDEAERYYRKALDAGYLYAYSSLASLATSRDDGKKSEADGIAWLRKGADIGHASSISLLASRYESGYGVTKDLREAERLFERAIALGNTYSLYSLAVLLTRKENPARDTGRALASLDRFDEYFSNGDFYRALLYQYYFDDAERATGFYVNAARKDPDSGYFATQAAERFEKGLGVEKNLALAQAWYERAANISAASGAYHLARFYMQALGVPRDADKAATLILLARTRADWLSRNALIENKGKDISPDVIVAIQKKLIALGMMASAPTGAINDATIAALYRLGNPFENDITDEQIVATR